MFTGIVEELGSVDAATNGRLVVRCDTVSEDAVVGASISVNGVCLTVVGREDRTLVFDLAPETRARTTLEDLASGDPVNLERPLTLLTRLGGHLVQGHVDGVGTVREVLPSGGGAEVTIDIPADLERYVAQKGSVAVDGVSLTVAAVLPGAFRVALIPHTVAATTLGRRRPGDRVNVETDLLAKHVERLLGGGT
jgi:riboflavin synthase